MGLLSKIVEKVAGTKKSDSYPDPIPALPALDFGPPSPRQRVDMLIEDMFLSDRDVRGHDLDELVKYVFEHRLDNYALEMLANVPKLAAKKGIDYKDDGQLSMTMGLIGRATKNEHAAHHAAHALSKRAMGGDATAVRCLGRLAGSQVQTIPFILQTLDKLPNVDDAVAGALRNTLVAIHCPANRGFLEKNAGRAWSLERLSYLANNIHAKVDPHSYIAPHLDIAFLNAAEAIRQVSAAAPRDPDLWYQPPAPAINR